MMSPEESSQKTKICPTCGTRLPANATRCLVCGRSFAAVETAKEKKPKTEPTVQSPKLPEVTLSLPIAIGLILLILAIGAGAVWGVMRGSAQAAVPATPSATPSLTPTITMTPTATATAKPEATWTPLPPIEYTVAAGDNCITIAAQFNVSVTSIIAANNLSAACDNLNPGQVLSIPQPTLTPSPQPTGTLSPADATEIACETMDYIVQPNDTLFQIAANYNVSMEAIQNYNGLASDVVYEGMPLVIPLCERLPTPGPTPTPTNPPPYPAPNLLLPADGAVFTAANDSVALQWAAVGTLLQNEAYAVTVEDITEGKGRKLTEYVTDTKFNVPASFRPTDTQPHVLKWSVITVRQIGSSLDGKPIYEPAGAASAARTFVWWSTGGATVTPTP